MPLSQWLITTNYYEGGYFRAWSPLFSLSLFTLWFSPSSIFCFCFLSFSFPPTALALLILCLSSLARSLPLSRRQAVVRFRLIAVEINKADKFVFLLYCVTEEGRRFLGQERQTSRAHSEFTHFCSDEFLTQSIHGASSSWHRHLVYRMNGTSLNLVIICRNTVIELNLYCWIRSLVCCYSS